MSSSSENNLTLELFVNLQSDVDRIEPEVIEKAKKGDGKSLFNIGVQYYNKKIYTKAMAWFQLSAKKNYGDALVKLGTMYQNGFGVAVDYQHAIKWHVKAAELGYTVAFSHIGFLFEKGLGVPMDKQKAFELYLKFKRYTSGVVRLENEGYSLKGKEKSNEELLNDVKLVLREENQQIEFSNNAEEWEQIKKRMDKMQSSKQSTVSIEQVLRNTNERVKLLEISSEETRHNQSHMRDMIERLQRLNQELVTSLDSEMKRRKEEVRNIKQENDKVIKQLKKENNDIKQRLDLFEKFAQNLNPVAFNNIKASYNDNNDLYYDSE